MGWEERGNNIYYYRKVRDGETVRSEYVGSGQLALIIAAHDAEERRKREAEWQREKAELRLDEEIDDLLKDVEYRLKTVTKAHLLNLGFSQTSSREWRLSRNGKRNN